MPVGGVQPLGGMPEVQLLRDGNELPEVSETHLPPFVVECGKLAFGLAQSHLCGA